MKTRALCCSFCGETYNLGRRRARRAFRCHCGLPLIRAPVPFARQLWLSLRFVALSAGALIITAQLLCLQAFLLVVLLDGPFITGHRRSKQAEAKSNLKSLWTAQKAHWNEFEVYEDDFRKVGFSPERGNRYAYYGKPVGPMNRRYEGSSELLIPYSIIGAEASRYADGRRKPEAFVTTGCPVTTVPDESGVLVGLGVSGWAPEQRYLAVAAGNLDGDPEFDCWSIATFDRIVADGEGWPAGWPYNEQSDLSD